MPKKNFYKHPENKINYERLKNTYGLKKYRIQEVIKPWSSNLNPSLKRGEAKGAALTTFISLAGKYMVLMPNIQKVGNIKKNI